MNLVNKVIIFKMTKLVRLRAQLPKIKHTPNQLLAVIALFFCSGLSGFQGVVIVSSMHTILRLVIFFCII
ncbi:hypothetical protein P8452_75240 [Trifolium repens]|nr:hypothetical protein P8452_75240 [Trifolium repens]